MDLIEQMGNRRVQNNGPWMTILRIAYESDPERTAVALLELAEGDLVVVELAKKLAEAVTILRAE